MRQAMLRLAALLLVLAAVACGSDEERLAEHLERGDAYLEEGQYAEAVIEYKNVLQIDPNQPAAHWGLARAYLKSERVRQGYWELRETVRLDPDNVQARLQFGQLSRLAGEAEESLAQADAVIALEEDNMAAHLLRAQALEALDRLDEARQVYVDTVERFPDEAAPLLLTANFLLSQGLRAEAEPYYRKLTEVKPGFSSYAALAGFLSREGRAEEAEQAYRKARELAEGEEVVLGHRVLASFYYSRGRYEDAERVLSEALEQNPGDLDLIYVLARFYAARGDQERADEMIREATRARPDDVRPYLVLSAYRGKQGDAQGALEAAEQALEVDPEHLPARLRKAELLIDMGYREEDPRKTARGKSIVDAVLSQDPSSPEGLFVRAKVALAENRPKEAATDLRRALDIRENWAEAHYLLGSALFVQRDLNAARAELLRALEIDAQFTDARKLLTRVHSVMGEYELAVEDGQTVLREEPGEVLTRLLTAQALVRLERLDEARALLTELPDDAHTGETLYALGRVYRLEGDVEKARELFLRADEALPNQPDVLQALLELDRREGRIAESIERIQAAVQAEPENAKLMHLLGLVQVLSGQGTQAEASFRKAIDLDPNNLAPYQSLAQYLALTGRREEVLATYERAAATRPDSAGLQLVLGSLYEAYGNVDKARETYEKAIQMDPQLAPAKNNLAYILAEAGENLDRALDLAQEAKSMLPENGHAADTLGWVLHKKGISSAAVGYLKEAEGLFRPEDPSLAIVRLHLAQAQEANGEPGEARQTLQRALRDLERIRESYRQATGQEPQEPAWAADIRTMLQRLEGESQAQGG